MVKFYVFHHKILEADLKHRKTKGSFLNLFYWKSSLLLKSKKINLRKKRVTYKTAKRFNTTHFKNSKFIVRKKKVVGHIEKILLLFEEIEVDFPYPFYDVKKNQENRKTKVTFSPPNFILSEKDTVLPPLKRKKSIRLLNNDFLCIKFFLLTI